MQEEKNSYADGLNDNQISNHQVEDNGAKLIFGNPTLCAQLLRDYSNIDLLKNVKPEDITDVTERYIPMFTEERNADVVKQVKVGEDEDVFIALIEHKSHVDYNVAMQILRYMVYIWEDYEKQQEKKYKGVSKLKSFKYPPIFPIVYYNGEEKWTADHYFKNRIELSDVFSTYIPDFCYHLVNTSDYHKEDLFSKNDGLSFIMIVNKIKETNDLRNLGFPKEYLDNLSANSPQDVLDVLAKVVAVLLRKHCVPENEIQGFISQIKERKMSDLFEGWRGFSVIEERKKGKEQGDYIRIITLICKKLIKGKDADTIIDELEADDEAEKIKELIEISRKYVPDFDAEKIYEEYAKKHEKVEV